MNLKEQSQKLPQSLTIEPALEAIVKAGRLLMENGAEIHRIELTVNHMAQALGIKGFEAFVMNRGIFVSGLNSQGLAEAKVITTQETGMNLRILDEVNALSRRISQEPSWTPSNILQELNHIEGRSDYSALTSLLAYFVGAGGFAWALGSTLIDTLISASTGLFIGLLLHWMNPWLKTSFVRIILASGLATLAVHGLVLTGLGQSRSLILLGAFMVLIPGATFVNAIREFSQSNYPTGLSLALSALLTCISISVGVAASLGLIPRATPLSAGFSLDHLSILDFLTRSLAAGIGTVAFSVFYSVPRRFFKELGVLGTLTWLLYLIIATSTGKEALAIFIPGLIIAAMSQILAIYRKSPATMFLVTSMFPLLPGISFYRATYLVLTGSTDLALQQMRTSFISAFTIAIAITLAQQIPWKKWLSF
ncbi:threonine/serine ThrE exporter family protein [Streptococcus caprae]|uniref:Threonine/serine exporter ThrE family protein n=1 Tax=Streptococcus caprae TaxID=1640501 RepID=A0ABV8CUY1_9STRE